MAMVRRSSDLPIPATFAIELAQRVALFEFVVAPVIKMRSLDIPPEGISEGAVVSGRIWWGGVLPSWRHTIQIVTIGDNQIYTNEHGGPVRTWNHRLTFDPLPDGGCRYTDEIELDDGLDAAATRLFARLMFWYRHRRWATLARVLAPSTP